MKKIQKRNIFLIMVLISIALLSACAKVEQDKNIMSEQIASEDTEPENTEPDTLPQEQTRWRVNKCPDLPKPYIEVLEHYEEFMNADNRNINDESVQTKLWGGEWKDLYDELCASLLSWESETEDFFFYALKDLTDDGFPEMVIAYKDIPYIIYTYNEDGGIGMEHASSYFKMTIYDNKVIEYVSGGMYSSTTYLQFQEDTCGWVVVDTIAYSGTWDSATQSMTDTEFYGGEWDGSGRLDTQISEEEYQQIRQKYVTKPMTFEWIPLVYHAPSADS